MCLFLLLYSFQYILCLFIRQSGCIGFFAHNSMLKFFIEKYHLRIWKMQMFICIMTFALIRSSIIDIQISMLLLLTSTTLQTVAYWFWDTMCHHDISISNESSGNLTILSFKWLWPIYEYEHHLSSQSKPFKNPSISR